MDLSRVLPASKESAAADKGLQMGDENEDESGERIWTGVIDFARERFCHDILTFETCATVTALNL